MCVIEEKILSHLLTCFYIVMQIVSPYSEDSSLCSCAPFATVAVADSEFSTTFSEIKIVTGMQSENYSLSIMN